MNMPSNKERMPSPGGSSTIISVLNMLAVSGFVIYMFVVG